MFIWGPCEQLICSGGLAVSYKEEKDRQMKRIVLFILKHSMNSRRGTFQNKKVTTNNGLLAKLITAGGGNSALLSATQTTAFSPWTPEIWVNASNYIGEI